MSARALFFAADGRVRPPWRIALFLLIAALCTAIVGVAFQQTLWVLNDLTGSPHGAGTFGVMLGALLAHAIMLRWVDKRPWSDVGLDKAAARPALLSFAWLLGAVPILVPSLVLLGVGLLAVRPAAEGSWWLAAAQVSLFLLPAAFSEELFSRGYLFATLRDWLGWPVALAVTSVGFGLVHIWNPGATAQSVTMVVLAGFFLGAVLIATGSLYAAWMTHWAWNWVMAVPLHVAVSGLPLPRPDYQVVDAGPDWITGGPWGPEGGIGAAAGMAGGFAYLYWRTKRRNEQLQR